MTTATETPGTDIEPVISAGLMQQFESMALRIPESDDSQAYEDIVAQLLAANGVDGLNAPWDTSKAAKLNGHRLKIESMTRRPSDFGQGLGIYLVVKGTDLGTSERFTLTIGSVAVVAQLARMHAMDALPAVVELVVADKLTSNGYRPIHLNVLSVSGAK